MRTAPELIESLALQSRALAAVGAATQARSTGTPLDPAIQARVDEVLDALGLRRFIAESTATELRSMLGGIRSEVFLAARLVSQDAPVAATWSPTDPAVLQAAGDVSAGFPGVLEHVIAPQLERLPERLAAADGAFLDVGVGIAAMSIEMARRWPSLRVVGVDPWPASIEAARHNVRKAGLVTRIELRTQRAEDLADTERFDLAWVPGLFISADALPSVLDRVRQALRPGGWMLLALAAPTADPLVAALARLRTALWGGTQATASEAQTLLTRFGLVAVRTLSASRSLGIAIVAGQRAPIRPGSTERQLV